MAVNADDCSTRRPLSIASAVVAAAAVIAAAAMYGPLLIDLGRQWLDDADAGYGAIVALAAALAVCQRWPRLRALPVRGAALGVPALLVALALYAAGVLAADVFLLRVSLVAWAAAVVLFVLGRAQLTLLASPLALLLISIPLPGLVVAELTMPLQLMSTRAAAALMELAGVQAIRDGNILTLGNVSLEVAEACSGLRSLVTLAAMAACYAALRGLSAGVTIALMLASVPIALAGNSLRVAFTGVLASRIGESAARGFVHDATGWAAFASMCLALVAWHRLIHAVRRVSAPAFGPRLRWRLAGTAVTRGRRDASRARAEDYGAADQAAAGAGGWRLAAGPRMVLVAGALAALSAWTHAHDGAVAVAPDLDREVPARLGEWAGQPAPALDPAVARVLAADQYVHRFYRAGHTWIEMDIAYYGRPRAGARMHSPLNCLPGNGWQIIEGRTLLLSDDLAVRRLVVGRTGQRIGMTYWFQNRGEAIANDYGQRFLLLANGLRGRPTDAALVRVMVTEEAGAADALVGFTRQLAAVLRSAFR